MQTFLTRLFIALLLLGSQVTKADEGMWLLMNLYQNYDEMQDMGLELTPEQIYSVNESSLKDAVVSLRFCTAELVSPEGLMFTNHHCAYSAIQANSSVEHDYLTDGIWAASKAEELPTDITASILIRMEDVTEQVLEGVTADMAEAERNAMIRKNSAALEETLKGETDYRIEIKSMLKGNQYVAFVYETFEDVRLVGAPPSAIGKFGGDEDNWEWPRHTGDFSLLRIYTAPDGSSAAYNEENVPYQPRHFFPISLKGVEKEDYAMVMGFPGRTQRYLTSHGIRLAQEKSNPSRIKIRTALLDIMKAAMNQDDAVRIQYASKYSRMANYWKYFIGQNEGLARLQTVAKKEKQEAAFQQWAEATPERKADYGTVLAEMAEAYTTIAQYDDFVQHINEAGLASEAMRLAYRFSGLGTLLAEEEVDEEKVKEAVAGLQKRLDSHFKDYYAPLDQQLFAASMRLFYAGVPADQMPEKLVDAQRKYKGDFKKMADKYFKKSMFNEREELDNFLSNPTLKKLEKDPLYALVTDLIMTYRSKIAPAYREAKAKEQVLMRSLVKGMMEMQPDRNFYPDANSSIRLTYGSVGGYTPRDAVRYQHYTTIDGIMEKRDPNDAEFIVPDKLVELYEAGDYGRYGWEGTLPVNFITNNDITGGNSGSPVIDGAGNLIGIAFDGNWEAMTGDLVFDKALKRCINVDIRYVLFIMDKYAGAQNLLDEMTIKM